MIATQCYKPMSCTHWSRLHVRFNLNIPMEGYVHAWLTLDLVHACMHQLVHGPCVLQMPGLNRHRTWRAVPHRSAWSRQPCNAYTHTHPCKIRHTHTHAGYLTGRGIYSLGGNNAYHAPACAPPTTRPTCPPRLCQARHAQRDIRTQRVSNWELLHTQQRANNSDAAPLNQEKEEGHAGVWVGPSS